MTVPSEATSPRPSAPTSELRTRILREATRLFAEKGYAATSVREVVEASGCTKPALYYYFKSKDALFLEVDLEGVQRLTRQVDSGAGAVKPLPTRAFDWRIVGRF